jgi:hypothetical protein
MGIQASQIELVVYKQSMASELPELLVVVGKQHSVERLAAIKCHPSF